MGKMGVYLHMLADRASHWWCTDSKYSGVTQAPDGFNFTAKLDKMACNFVRHAMEHYWEQGVEMPLAPSSWAAISLYYDELLSFKQLPGASAFFNHSVVPIPKAVLIGNKTNPGSLPRQIVKTSATERVGGLH